MLLNAMDNFILATRDYNEQQKAQYTDKGDVKNYFRASEMGYSDRKIIYGFFKHQIPTVPKSSKNLRQLANGDGVHARYQKWWEDMGVLISMEERLSSKDDEYLAQFPWEWAGHYDGLLDLNILRAHALGLCKISYSKNEEEDKWEMEVEVDDEYANSIGLFDEDENGDSSYEPLTMVADIKTMNPWGFKRIKDKGSLEEIQGYIDQISFYMYMLNTPYASIFVEAKDSNELLEIQVVWTDMHEGVEYTFDPEIHGEQREGIVRTTINNERFFGSETVEGLVPRISKLWEIKELLEKADTEGDSTTLASVMPPRCSEDPGKFPCSWGGGKDKCEYFDHCWNQFTNGLAVKAYEACPEEFKWHITDREGEIFVIDSRKVPEGIVIEALQALFNMGAVDIEKFKVDEAPIPIADVVEEADISTGLLSASGELNLGAPTPVNMQEQFNTAMNAVEEGRPVSKSTEAIEYINKDRKKAIKCLNCGKELTYQKLGNGCTKKCEFCNHVNKVLR